MDDALVSFDIQGNLLIVLHGYLLWSLDKKLALLHLVNVISGINQNIQPVGY